MVLLSQWLCWLRSGSSSSSLNKNNAIQFALVANDMIIASDCGSLIGGLFVMLQTGSFGWQGNKRPNSKRISNELDGRDF